MNLKNIKITKTGMLLLIAGMLCGCGRQADEDNYAVVDNSDNSLSYEFVTVETGDVYLTEKARCTYQQQNEQKVSFSLTGRLVDKVYVREGDFVKKGDLLAELSIGTLKRDIEDLQYRIARNEMRLEFVDKNEALDVQRAWVNFIDYTGQTEDDKKRTMESVEEINRQYRYQREDCQDALEVDRQELQELQQELKHCSAYAGMDGLVYKVKEELDGSTSKAEETVITIVDNSECLFEINCPQYANCFREGEPVSMMISSGSAAGQYELLPYEMESWGENQRFSVLDGPVTSGIEVGTAGTMQFTIDSRENVMCLPKLAVHMADDRFYTYVVDEDGMRQIRWVEVGLQGDDLVEITGGLEVGERVVRR